MTATDQGKLISKKEIDVDVGLPSPKTAEAWYAQQIPYRNYAGFSQALDSEVRAFVMDTVTGFRNRMDQAFRRWTVNWATVNSEGLNQEHEDDVVMPETRKALEGKVSRIEEALFSFDPFFHVEGVRGDLKDMKGQVISAYMRRLLEQTNFRNYVGPAVRDVELCNCSAIKVTWDRIVEDVIDRKVELRFTDDGQAYYHDERRMRKAVVYDGPKLNLVDPYYLVFDLDAGQVEDCSYIGDESEVFLHDLERQAELGIYPEDAIKKIRNRETPDDTSNSGNNRAFGDSPVEQYKQSRTIVQPSLMERNAGVTGSVRTVRMIDMWAWYDFGKGHDGVVDPLGKKITGPHRVEFTVASGQVIKISLNPYDRKFFPYAIARLNVSGHEMVAASQFDDVIGMNLQYDRFQSNVLRRLSSALSPKIITNGQTDLPDNIDKFADGHVFKQGGDFKQVLTQDVPQSVSYFHQFFRREIEETSGALRIFESPQGTATETERKVQEQQRMVRRDIRAVAEQWRRVVLIMYWMSAQFSTQRQRFSVVGKAAQRLGKQFSITPEMLQEDIDVRFLGLDNLHTYGSRGTGMAQWMQEWGPLVTMLNGFSIDAAARLAWEHKVGDQDINLVFPDYEPPWMLWSQEEENEMLMAGQAVPISKHDNDQRHMSAMLPLLRKLKDSKYPDYVVDSILEHYQSHARAAERKRMEEEARALQAEQRAAAQGPEGTVPGRDGPAAPGGMPAQEKGTTPGPTQNRTVARTGREGSGRSQVQQMSLQ